MPTLPRLLLLIPSVVLTTALIACEAPDRQASASGGVAPDVQVRLVLPDAPTVGPADITVHVTDGEAPVEGARVELTGDMTHAGMEPVIEAATGGEEGRYRTADFAFTMAGDWILTAEVTLPSGDTVLEETQVRVSQP
ncbi:MAG: FixH family protein [Trueperaceae bacterium]|nr:FixH family protein [Trueperaceae bacterium]